MTILNIVESGDLVAEKRRKMYEWQFATLIILFTAYFFAYITITLVMSENEHIVKQMVTFNLCNNIIVLLVLILYSFTIILLRKSIAKCASFQFETRGTYVIASLYIVTLFISLAFLFTY